MDEHLMYRVVKRHVERIGGSCWRIENRVGVGMPDILVALKGVAPFFIECKCKRTTFNPLKSDKLLNDILRTEQKIWLRQFTAQGGTSAILLARPFPKGMGVEIWAAEVYKTGEKPRKKCAETIAEILTWIISAVK